MKTELQLSTRPQSIVETVRRIAAEGGVKPFFQGNLANCLKVAPQSSLFFALTDHFKRTLPTRGDPAYERTHSFLSGTLAGLVSQFLVYPFEPIKTVLTVAPKGQYTGILDCGRQLLRSGGVWALYRGAVPTLAGCIPYAGIQRMTYDSMQRQYTFRSNSQQPSAVAGFISGLVSSSLGMTASYPLLLLRTRLQMQGTGPGHPVVYTGVFDGFKKVIASEGPVGLFKGIVPNLAKGAPAAAVNFVLYEQFVLSLQKVMADERKN